MTDPDVTGAVKGAGEIAKTVGKIYDDLAAPLANQVGQTAGSLAEAILTGPREVFMTVTQAQQWLGAEVRRRLDARGISAKAVVAPSTQLYAGTVHGLLTAGHEEELREMFANLLASAMTDHMQHTVHPSFAEIIRQLSRNEARLIRPLREDGYFPTVWIAARQHQLGGTYSFSHAFAVVADQLNIPMGMLDLHFDNLQRLGLARVITNRELNHPDEYDALEKDPRVTAALRGAESATIAEPFVARGFVEITAMGIAFTSACLGGDLGRPLPALSTPYV